MKYFFIALGAAAIIYIRFSNPEMTETQLFLNYWLEYLVAAALVIYGATK